MARSHRYLKMPWPYVFVGGALVMISITNQLVIGDYKANFTPGPVMDVLRIVGGVMLLLSIALGVRTLLDQSPIKAKLLNSHDEIYKEARRMVERCKGHEWIRATSITTKWPGSDDPAARCVEEFFRALASRCAAAKMKGQALTYMTILGFGSGGKEIPPEQKRPSIIQRQKFFANEGAGDRLKLMYLETGWSLDVVIAGSDEMIIGFPTRPRDGKFYMGLKIKDADFVGRAVEWYDHVVLHEAKELTWQPQFGDAAARETVG